METTIVTLATGRQIEVKGTYGEVQTTLKERVLSAETGVRELTKTCGQKVQVALGAVLAVEEVQEVEKQAIGFGAVLA